MGTRASIDPELCIGSAECNRLAPDAFLLDEETGVSAPLPGAESADEAELIAAAEACPTQAIRLRRADGSVLHGEP